MFSNSEQLFEFIEKADETLMDQVFEGAVADTCLYEEDYIVKALDSYVGMLESGKIDEKFEEHLSTVMVPYFSNTAEIYEIASKFGGSLANSGKPQYMNVSNKKSSRAKITDFAKKKLDSAKENISSTKGNLSSAKEKLGTALSNAAFDAKFKGSGFLKSMRHKYGPKALANKIKRGYQSASKWATGIPEKLKAAYAGGMLKLSNAKAKGTAAAKTVEEKVKGNAAALQRFVKNADGKTMEIIRNIATKPYGPRTREL